MLRGVMDFTSQNDMVPDVFTGKTLDVFGGGAELLKLRSVCSAFPHDDDTNNAKIWDIYEDAFVYLRFIFIEVFVLGVV